METKAVFKNIKISPKKLRMLLTDVKRLTPERSLDYLYNTPKKGAKLLYKLVKSAISNAKNSFKVEGNLLKFRALTVDQGQTLKRFKAGGRGTVAPIKRRFSHVTIILSSQAPVKETSQPVAEKAKEKKTVVTGKVKNMKVK